MPICSYGSKPTDDGNLILDENELEAFKKKNPSAARYIRPLISSDEYLDGRMRWCFWLLGAKPGEVRKSSDLIGRIEGVKKFRARSEKKATRSLAAIPSLFAEIRQPAEPFLLIPQHTSNERKYIPLTFFEPHNILHNSCSAVIGADLYVFGFLSSVVHIAWLKRIGGRIKSDPRYSITLVYNNFPWPPNPTPAQRAVVEREAQAVLDARALFPKSTLADLYNPLFMPVDLLKAHKRLDRAVEKCYRPQPFSSDRERVEFLFALYEQLSAPLLPPAPKKTRRSVIAANP